MSDVVISVRAAELGKTLEGMTDEIESQFNDAVADLANTALSAITVNAQTALNTTSLDYLKGLDMQQIGPASYVITLDGDWANALEEGFPGFNMRDKMLNSEKVVGIGTRTGEKWVQRADGDGHKFAHVPFEQKPYSKLAGSADMNEAIKKLTALNRQGIEQKFTSIFKDDLGKALEGRVATVKKVEGYPNLAGITKYQRKSVNETTGKETLQSHYMVFRTVSEIGEDWMHPGFAGLKAFDDAEAWVISEIDNIINNLIK